LGQPSSPKISNQPPPLIDLDFDPPSQPHPQFQSQFEPISNSYSFSNSYSNPSSNSNLNLNLLDSNDNFTSTSTSNLNSNTPSTQIYPDLLSVLEDFQSLPPNRNSPSPINQRSFSTPIQSSSTSSSSTQNVTSGPLPSPEEAKKKILQNLRTLSLGS